MDDRLLRLLENTARILADLTRMSRDNDDPRIGVAYTLITHANGIIANGRHDDSKAAAGSVVLLAEVADWQLSGTHPEMCVMAVRELGEASLFAYDSIVANADARRRGEMPPNTEVH
jgi:hypothetical protein